MKILLSVDASDCTTRMLGHLASHKELLAGDHEVTLFTVVDPRALQEAAFGDARTLDGLLRQQAERVLGPARVFAERRGWRARADHVPGTPAVAIAEKAAALGADLIVMGAHARSPLGAFVLGSVTSGVMARCSTPVLVIR